MTQILDVRASQLQTGDLLLASLRHVKFARTNPWDRSRVLVELSGEGHSREWNARTTLRVARDEVHVRACGIHLATMGDSKTCLAYFKNLVRAAAEDGNPNVALLARYAASFARDVAYAEQEVTRQEAKADKREVSGRLRRHLVRDKA